jgi:hypothetical protein
MNPDITNVYYASNLNTVVLSNFHDLKNLL